MLENDESHNNNYPNWGNDNGNDLPVDVLYCQPCGNENKSCDDNDNISQQLSQQSNDKGKEAFDNVPSFLYCQPCNNMADFNDDSADSWNLPTLNAKNQPAELQQHYQAAVEVASPSSQTQQAATGGNCNSIQQAAVAQ